AAPTLTFVPDNAGRPSVAAAPSADVDLFRFVVPDTGLLIPAPGGPLSVYDQSGQALRQDNLGQFFVVGGQAYFLPTTRPVRLSLAAVTAAPIALGADGFSSQEFSLAAGKADVFPLVPQADVLVTVTGTLLDGPDPARASTLKSVLSVYDERGNLITK